MPRHTALRLLSLIASLAAIQMGMGGIQAATVVHQIDAVHSSLVFHITHMGSSTVWGSFAGAVGKTGTLTFDPADPGQDAIDLTIPTASIDTRSAKRDHDLKGPDFFDVKRFPTMHFVSTAWKALDAGRYQITGNLTLHGVTQPITITAIGVGDPAHAKPGSPIGFDTSFVIKRSDYGMTALVANGMVGDEVTIFISIGTAPGKAKP